MTTQIPKTTGEAAKLFREHAECLRNGGSEWDWCLGKNSIAPDRFDARAGVLEDFFENPNTPLSDKFNREWDWPGWVAYHDRCLERAAKVKSKDQ